MYKKHKNVQNYFEYRNFHELIYSIEGKISK